MNRINPKKLVLSKWTAVKPVRKEKHFLVTEVDYDEAGAVISCTIEAILSKRPTVIQWRDLQDSERWLQGWK